ncbi:serine protease snake-like [Achroia grisella]|uniref:serine protease snake-like n=1 Tax=Achroia grisella TaxID=688607 RepID=UPI0027D2ABC8|nr:serine protease snake-like [Achroia grisella]
MLFQNILTYLCEEAVKQTRLDEWFNSIFYGRTKSNGYDIDGGTDAKSLEFPYTALLGYGDDAETREWLCGGAVISSYFILTAGHCTYSRDFGSVTQVSVGLLRRSEQLQFYKIKNIIQHPDYHPPSKYNDIALLKTEQKIQYNLNVLPACLHSGFPVSDEYATAVGWGALGYIRKNADVLQKVKLQKFTRVECSKEYPTQRHLKFGVNYTTQICYGDYKQNKDTCQGDSGGPLIAEHSKFPCLQSIVGITSFGKPCGMGGRPGIYTRVAPYVPWIESIVWPCD